jgi:carbamoyl-phosphate synthase large subunit
MADKVYFLPVNPEYVEKVIENERPDSILLGFGGQTALNCGVQLAKLGILDKYDVKVIGTPIEGIEITEDRKLFKQAMLDANIPVPPSEPAYSLEEARRIADKIGYPVIIRVAYTLGGKGGGVARNEVELDTIVSRGLAASLVHQVLVEKYVGGWKQVEYEVMRDWKGNSVTVCNMENLLGMRVHTGDNIVIAPSQTLNNREYHLLRMAAIRATKRCMIIGECNIQFALDTNSEDYYAIEINARLSRSSALASKATGYPLAYMAAKLALGYTLDELINKVTGITTACFEPSLDYVVLKMPRWDIKKFERASAYIGTSMKSVGEVMAIGRNFEEVLQKAIRMLDVGLDGFITNEQGYTIDEIENKLVHPTYEIIFDIAKALKLGMSVERVSKIAEIDPWFVTKMKRIVDMEAKLSEYKKIVSEIDDLEKVFNAHPEFKELVSEAKKIGFSDKQISKLIGINEIELRKVRRKIVKPVVKQIDTLAAEWPAKTNYLYLTYNGSTNDIKFSGKKRKKVIVLGAGVYRIGSSVEFDWCTMNMVWALKERGIDEVIVINCNPETVSTDYDMSDRLYFEELTLERVLDIYEHENPLGIVTCVGGQVANNLTPKLSKEGVKILGTSSEDVDRAENRAKFSALLDYLGIKQPEWSTFTSLKDAYEFARNVGYPVLVRPSYVLSGAAMRVVWTPEQLGKFLTMAAEVSPEHPVVISKFLTDAKEVEVDAVADGENVLVGAVIEHVERAGVHSGDAIMAIPPQTLSKDIIDKIVDYTERIAKALHIIGPFNIQYIAKGNEVYVIECNLRASRSMPYVSKFTGVNLMEKAADAILGKKIEKGRAWEKVKGMVAVKVPQFSFMQIEGSDPVLGVEMQSTGEVACFGRNFFEAFFKAMIAAGLSLPKERGNVLITVGGVEWKGWIIPIAKTLEKLGYKIFATEHTAEYLIKNNVNVQVLHKIREPKRKPNIIDYLVKRKLDIIINIPSAVTLEKYADQLEDEYLIRRRAVELGIPMLTSPDTIMVFVKGLEWLKKVSKEAIIDSLSV